VSKTIGRVGARVGPTEGGVGTEAEVAIAVEAAVGLKGSSVAATTVVATTVAEEATVGG